MEENERFFDLHINRVLDTIIFSTILFLTQLSTIGAFRKHEADDAIDEDVSFVHQPKADFRSGRRHTVVRQESLPLKPTPNRLKLIPTSIMVIIGILVVVMLVVAGALIYIVFFLEDQKEEDEKMLDQYAQKEPIDFWSQEGATLQEQEPPADQRYEAELSVDFSTSRSSSRSTRSDREAGKIASS